MKQTGMFWHVHHDVLIEYCHSYDERKGFILHCKPENEQKLRLKLFQPIKGKLPKKFIRARDKFVKARNKYVKTKIEYCKARDKYYKAWDKYVKARDGCKKEIEALHAKECPNCPWDGKTIFPKENT